MIGLFLAFFFFTNMLLLVTFFKGSAGITGLFSRINIFKLLRKKTAESYTSLDGTGSRRKISSSALRVLKRMRTGQQQVPMGNPWIHNRGKLETE